MNATLATVGMCLLVGGALLLVGGLITVRRMAERRFWFSLVVGLVLMGTGVYMLRQAGTEGREACKDRGGVVSREGNCVKLARGERS